MPGAAKAWLHLQYRLRLEVLLRATRLSSVFSDAHSCIAKGKHVQPISPETLDEDCLDIVSVQVSNLNVSLQMDEDVKEIVRMLVRCAYGSPLDTSSKIPSPSACVEVAVRENAFNPLSSPSVTAQRDERIYVAFQQHIVFQVGLCS